MKHYYLGIAGVVAIVLLLVAPAGAETWGTEVVDNGNKTGQYSSLALDTEGFPHISYNDESDCYLRYASWNGTGWTTAVVDSGGDVGFYTSLAFDSSGYPHISYYDNTKKDLKYAFLNGTGWETATVDSDDNVGIISSLALDLEGFPHISYCDTTNTALKYAFRNGTVWETATVDSDDNLGGAPSLALDSDGFPHISYIDNTKHDLKYASWNGTGWETATVDNDGDVGYGTSLALDPERLPHISYYDYSNGALKYTSWNGTGWETATVERDDNAGYVASLALDSEGFPHISYCDYANRDLKYASWDGTKWATIIVDSDSVMGYDSSLALDSFDAPHISYAGNTEGNLKYARTWTAPVPEFIGSPTSGTAPLTVVFNDTSTGEPTAWVWSFGDGDGSIEENPAHTYQTPGEYNVTLTVTNPDGSNTRTETGYITVSPSGVSYDILLSAGWNMVSVPVTDAVVTKPQQMMDTVYGYDPVNLTYAEVNLSALAPGVGYWVSATGACTLTVNGTDVDCYQTNLCSGWNMIGAVCGNTSFSDPQTNPADSVQNYVYGYSPASGRYVSTTNLTSGAGYWASATQNCLLNVSA